MKKKTSDFEDYNRYVTTNLLACTYRNEDPEMTKKFKLFMAKQKAEACEEKKSDLLFDDR